MHEIEPFFNWRDHYTAENDKLSPFYGNTYNETSYETTIYNYYIHPQWDTIQSEDLYVKLLYANYVQNYAIIELIGEWNDAIENDVELFLRNLIYPLMKEDIYQFIVIGENVFNFHGEIDDYYAEWHEEVSEKNGWIVGINFREHVIREMKKYQLHQYLELHEPFDDIMWRSFKPQQLYQKINQSINQRLHS